MSEVASSPRRDCNLEPPPEPTWENRKLPVFPTGLRRNEVHVNRDSIAWYLIERLFLSRTLYSLLFG
jgi:hypothetical protein